MEDYKIDEDYELIMETSGARSRFKEYITQMIRDGLNDQTPAKGGTYAENLRKLRIMAEIKYKDKINPTQVLDYVVLNLMPRYKSHVEEEINTLRSSLLDDNSILHMMFKIYDQVEKQNQEKNRTVL